MTISRKTEMPYPRNLKSFADIEKYLKKLSEALSTEQSALPEMITTELKGLSPESITITPDNTHGWASPLQIVSGHVSFASTGTWRTVAKITFTSTDYGGGYLVFSFGGLQNAVGGGRAVLIGTFNKNGAADPSFTSLSNVATNCTVQATANGATELVVQMESSSGANTLAGNFVFMVMGSSIYTLTATAPGYSD